MKSHLEAASRRRRTGEEVSRLVSAFETSGLRAGTFCRRYGLAPSTLRRRLKKQRVREAQAEGGVQLVEVTVNGALASGERAAGPALEVWVSGGRRIGVAPGFDATTFGRLVRALEAL